MPPPPQASLRLALLAVGGALAIAAVGVVGSLAFVSWRGHEQLKVLRARSDRCVRGDAGACDLLRSACLKRSADACVALADVLFADGPRRDPVEGARLLGDACTYLHGAACLRAGTLLLHGSAVPRDEAEGRRLLRRACELRVTEACGK